MATQLNVDIPEDLKLKFNRACAERQIDKKQAVAEALEAWIYRPEEDLASNIHMIRFAEILKDGDANTVQAVGEIIQTLLTNVVRPRATRAPAAKAHRPAKK